jgi:hypothetical protein
MSNHIPSTPSDAGPEAAPLDWMLALLREAMVGVMADDQPALKKANTLARLGSLYLKTYNTAGLKRLNAELKEQVAELEERMATVRVEATGDEEAAAVLARPEQRDSTAASKTARTKPSKPRSHGRPRPGKRRGSKPPPRPKTGR